MKKLLAISFSILLFTLSAQVYAKQDYTPLPPGSYAQSCSNCKIDRASSLKCSCADRNGLQRNTFLQNAQSCQSVENNDGQLQCSDPDTPRFNPWKHHHRRGKTVDIEAGPIWNQGDAQQKCPTLCRNNKGEWTGQWNTTVWAQMSVCQCRL